MDNLWKDSTLLSNLMNELKKNEQSLNKHGGTHNATDEEVT